MSQTKAHPEHESGKKHGDPLELTLEATETSATGHESVDAVPPAEHGGHAHSAAAHLDLGGKPDTKPAGSLRQGSHPGALREPPSVVQRAGKQHK